MALQRKKQADKPDIHSMDDAPRDGTTLYLFPGHVLAKHVPTRRFIGGRWHVQGKWIDPLTGARHRFDPTGWAPYDEKEQVYYDDQDLRDSANYDNDDNPADLGGERNVLQDGNR